MTLHGGCNRSLTELPTALADEMNAGLPCLYIGSRGKMRLPYFLTSRLPETS